MANKRAKHYYNDITGFSLMLAFMTVDTFSVFGNGNHVYVQDLMAKWLEGLETVCESFQLKDQPEDRRNDVGELVSMLSEMTSQTLWGHRNQNAITILEEWHKGLDRILRALLPDYPRAPAELRSKLSATIEYAMRESQNDRPLPIGMTPGFIHLEHVKRLPVLN